MSNYVFCSSLLLFITVGEKTETSILSITVEVGLSFTSSPLHRRTRSTGSSSGMRDTFFRPGQEKIWPIRKSIIAADQSKKKKKKHWLREKKMTNSKLHPGFQSSSYCSLIHVEIGAILNSCKVTGWPSVAGRWQKLANFQCVGISTLTT